MPILDLGDTPLHYETFGKGPPLLLIAGTAVHGGVWKPHQVAEFARDHFIIIYDQRGTGRSRTVSHDFSTTRLAADAAALLDHLDVAETIVLGHSMGGRIAQLLALDHPARIGRLILASTGSRFPSRGIPLEMCMELTEKGFERFLRDSCLRTGFTDAFIATHRAEVEAFMAIRLADPPKLEDFLRLIIARQDTDTTDRLKDIRLPTLVMVGGAETKADSTGISHWSSSEVLAREIPGARFAVIDGRAHYYPYVAPEPFHRVVRDFLGS